MVVMQPEAIPAVIIVCLVEKYYLSLPHVQHKIKRIMARYLDPKNDLIFKRIFGEHPHLLISFLNALMPLPPGRLIESVEYLPAKQMPETPLKKNSIVNVKCIDSCGQQFIVEMHIFWSKFFNRRLAFNASKAYVRRPGRDENCRLLQPVYGLGIIDEVFDHKTLEFYHHYRTVNRSNTDEVIEGLEFVLVELPKFKAEKWADRRMAVLWLRFLSEVEDRTENISSDLLENEEIREALTLCEEAAFTMKELEWYEQYWDSILTEKGLIETAETEGWAKGMAEGRAKGIAEGMAEGKAKGMAEIAVKCARKGMSAAEIADLTSLPVDEVYAILKQNMS
jgi:predicted transposase/invertase (TIGR01784 family)